MRSRSRDGGQHEAGGGSAVLVSSVNRRMPRSLKPEHPEKYADLAASAGPPNMLFIKETPLRVRAAATAILAIAALLVVVPCVVLFFAVNPGSAAQHLHGFQLPVTCWAAWALVSLWAALDSSRLWRLLGRPVDPLGMQAVWGILLGSLNIGAALLAVMLRISR